MAVFRVFFDFDMCLYVTVICVAGKPLCARSGGDGAATDNRTTVLVLFRDAYGG